jgi:hypothetical protein
MAMGIVHTYGKIWLKKLVLVLTFVLSFFAVSGYVDSHLANGKQAPETTVLTNRSIFLKNGISYKSAVLALYKPRPSFPEKTKHFNQNNFIYLNRITSRYAYLKWLFSSIKSNTAYLLKQQTYSTPQDHSRIGYIC